MEEWKKNRLLELNLDIVFHNGEVRVDVIPLSFLTCKCDKLSETQRQTSASFFPSCSSISRYAVYLYRRINPFMLCGSYACHGVVLRGRILVAVTSSRVAYELDPQTWEWLTNKIEWECGVMTVVKDNCFGVNMERRLGEVWSEERMRDEDDWGKGGNSMYRRGRPNIGKCEFTPFVFCEFHRFKDLKQAFGMRHEVVPFGADVLEWKGNLVVIGGLNPLNLAGEGPMLVYDVVTEQVLASLAGLRSCTVAGCVVIKV